MVGLDSSLADKATAVARSILVLVTSHCKDPFMPRSDLTPRAPNVVPHSYCVISEGERQYLISISPNIYRGNKANRAILERLATIQKNAERRTNLLLNSNTFEDYTNAVKGYRFEEMDAVEDIIDFAELNNG